MFSSYGCCWANDLAIFEQTLNIMMPPCMMNYFADNCPNLSPATFFCTSGMISDVGTIDASVLMNTTLQFGLPNMYNSQSVLNLRAVLASPLGYSPLNVLIKSFQYYDSNFDPITTSAISTAAAGIFNYGVVVPYITNVTLAEKALFLSGDTYESAIKSVYKNPNIRVVEQASIYYKAEPFEIENGSTSSVIYSTVFISLVACILSLILL
jgi:hypothetical protein